MYLPTPTSGGDFEQTPAGTHLATCYRFIDLGTQVSSYQGQEKVQRKVLLSWELDDCLMTQGEYAGKPFTFHQRYTWSMHEKATLRKHLEAWRGKPFVDGDFGEGGFNVRDIIAKACLLTLIEEAKGDKTYTNLSSVGALMRGMDTPALVNDAVFLSLEPTLYEGSVFNDLSDGLKETIRKSPEWQAVTGETLAPVESQPAPSQGHTQEQIPEAAYVNQGF